MRTQQQTIARLTEDIQRDAAKSYQGGLKYVGRKIGAFACVATTEHRVLLVRDAFKGSKTKNKKWVVNAIPKPDDPHFVLSDPNIMNGLRRLETVTKDSSIKWVKFSLSAEAGSVVLSASNADGIEGTETYDAESTADFEVVLNPAFILAAMGTWPLACYFKDDASPVVFMPKGKQRDFMYVVMPMKL